VSIVARIDNSGQLSLKGNVYTEWAGIDDTQNIDDIYSIDDTTNLDDTQELEGFFSALLGITTQQIDVDVNRLDSNGNFITSSVTVSSNTISLNNNSITVPFTILENQTL